MANTSFYRKANVPAAQAITALTSRYPKAELVSFETREAKTAEEASSAGVAVGETIYVATVRVAEFPPAEDKGDDSGDDSDESSEAPAEEKEEKSDEKSDDKEPSDGGDDKPPFEEGESGDGPSKGKPEDLIVHLLQKILHALEGGAGPVGPDAGPGGPGDLDLPDVGAPPAGGPALPPPGGPHGGPGKAPLPPPVKEKSPVGVGAFASVVDKAEAHVVRADANEIGNKALIAEVTAFVPGHRVARIQRTGSAVINGETVNLPETNQAVVTLVRK